VVIGEPYWNPTQPPSANSYRPIRLTLKDVQAWLAREHGLTLSLSAIDKFIRHKLGYRYKKNRGRQ
jgi:transposase